MIKFYVRNIIDWYRSKFKTFSGWAGIIGIILGGLYSWFYKDGYDLFVYMIIGFFISAIIVAIIEKIFIKKKKNF